MNRFSAIALALTLSSGLLAQGTITLNGNVHDGSGGPWCGAASTT